MGRDGYQHTMEQRFRDLSFQIECVKSRLTQADNALKVELAGRLGVLEHRRAILREKLDALCAEPDGTWDDLKSEIEAEWDALVQDFEERVASLA